MGVDKYKKRFLNAGDSLILLSILFSICGMLPKWKYLLVPLIVLFYVIIRLKPQTSPALIFGFFAGCNILCFLVYYSSFFLNESTSANLKSGLMCAQTSYTYGTTSTDVAIPLLVRDKVVHLDVNSKYSRFIGYFTNYQLDSIVIKDYDYLKDISTDMGAMAPNALDFYYEGISDETWDALYENRAHLYVLSDDVVNSSEIVMAEDKNMNVYFMTLQDYKKGGLR